MNARRFTQALALFLAIAAGCAPKQQQSLAYVVRPDPATGRVLVTADVRGPGGGEMSFHATMDFAGGPSSRHLLDLAATAADGRPLAVVRESGRLRLVVPADGRVTLRYALDVYALEGETGAAVTCVLDTARALLFGGQLFVVPVEDHAGAWRADDHRSEAPGRERPSTSTRVTVRLETPADWKVATSWGIERAEFAFAADSLDVLTDAVIAAGRYRLSARRTSDFSVVVVSRVHEEADAESLAVLAGDLCRRYEESLGTTPGVQGLIVFDGPMWPAGDPRTPVNAAGGGTATLLSTANALVIAAAPGDAVPEDPDFQLLLAHELFHWWCGANGVLAYRDDALLAMSEGFADYAGARALTRLGRWDGARMKAYLAARRATWAASPARDTPLAELAWSATGEGGDEEVARAKSALVAYAWDRELGAWSGGSAALPAVYRALLKRATFRPGGAFFGRRELAAALAEVAGAPASARELEAIEEAGLSMRLDSLIATDTTFTAPPPGAPPGD